MQAPFAMWPCGPCNTLLHASAALHPLLLWVLLLVLVGCRPLAHEHIRHSFGVV
jgi:hypothetical protein